MIHININSNLPIYCIFCVFVSVFTPSSIYYMFYFSLSFHYHVDKNAKAIQCDLSKYWAHMEWHLNYMTANTCKFQMTLNLYCPLQCWVKKVKVSKTLFLTQEIRIIHFSRILINFKNIYIWKNYNNCNKNYLKYHKMSEAKPKCLT